MPIDESHADVTNDDADVASDPESDRASDPDPDVDPDIDPDIDPDVDLRDPAERAETARREWDLLLAIAVGGALGAEARYGLAELIPHRAGQWPWATLVTNVVGSALLGALMVVLTEVLPRPPRLLRPFVGVGVLGGFTTFSTFALDSYQLLRADRAWVAVSYAVLSVLTCLLGVLLAAALARVLLIRGSRSRGSARSPR